MDLRTPTKAHHAAFDELSSLWAQRGALDEQQWTRLYALVMGLLEQNPSTLERGLLLNRNSVQSLRQSFFVDKILLPATDAGRELNPQLTPGALLVFYRRYLLDQIDTLQRSPERALTELQPTQRHGDEEELDFDDLAHRSASTCALAADSLAEGPGLYAAAESFMQEAEDWVVLYLSLHFCAGRERLPLSRLQALYGVASYHYKAKELGLAPPRGGFSSFEAYTNTRLGRWLVANGIAIVPENLEAIQGAFNLLCQAADLEFSRRELETAGPGMHERESA